MLREQSFPRVTLDDANSLQQFIHQFHSLVRLDLRGDTRLAEFST
jgi:hypothetical protein